MVACIASATSLRSHHNCHMEFLCPSEGAYPLWPKPGRLSAGYAAAHTDFHAQHVLSFCCAYFATAASFLPVQGMGYPAACATLIRAASARVRIGSPSQVQSGMLAVLRSWHGNQRAFALSQGLDPGQLRFHMHFGMVVFAASGAPISRPY